MQMRAIYPSCKTEFLSDHLNDRLFVFARVKFSPVYFQVLCAHFSCKMVIKSLASRPKYLNFGRGALGLLETAKPLEESFKTARLSKFHE